jgi:hypothetical protein
MDANRVSSNRTQQAIWRWEVGFTLRSLYPRQRTHDTNHSMEDCMSQEQAWMWWRKKHSYPCQKSKTVIQSVASLYWLNFSVFLMECRLTRRLWWDIIMQETVLCQRYRTSDGIKQMGTHNRSENGRGAWVVVCTHPSYTDTDTDRFRGIIEIHK